MQQLQEATLVLTLLTIEETTQMLRVGRTKLNSLIKREGLPVHRFGRRVLIDPEELRPWLAQRRQTS